VHAARLDDHRFAQHDVRGPPSAVSALQGVEELHFHDLRRAGLTLSAQAGATLAEVVRRAGHVSSATAIPIPTCF